MEISLPVLKIVNNEQTSLYTSFLNYKDIFSLLFHQDESFKELKLSIKINKTLPEYFGDFSIPIVNLLSEGKCNFLAESVDGNIGKLNIDLGNKLYFVEYEQLLQLKKNSEINENDKIILVIIPVDQINKYKNIASDTVSIKDKYYDLINKNIDVCDFDSLIEKERTSISQNSLKLLTLNSIKLVNEHLIVNVKDFEKEKLLIDFWKTIFEELNFISGSKAYEVRNNYIIPLPFILYTIAEVIVKPAFNEIPFSKRLKVLTEINWNKKNELWRKINLIDEDNNIQPESKEKFENYLTEFFKNKFNLKQEIHSSIEIYRKLREIIETKPEYKSKWEINDRGDGNASLKNMGDKVFLYFTHELGGVTINARISPNHKSIQDYTDIWQTSRRINKVGRWGDEIIDIRLNDYSNMEKYLELIDIISKK